MPIYSLVLILIAAFAHSTWNLLVVDVLTDGAGPIVDALYGRSSTASGSRQPH